MADQAENQGVSKSAKRRAAKKAREAAGEGEAPAAAAAPAEKKAVPSSNKENAGSKANNGVAPAAAQPKAKAKAKAEAKAEPKAKSAPEPPAGAKAKNKAKAAPAPAPKAEAAPKTAAAPKAKAAAAPEPKQAAKAKSQPKQAAKAPAKKEVVEEEVKVKREELVQPFEIDDGTGGGWEQSMGLSKKAQKQKEKAALREEEAKAAKKVVPGMAPADQYIPGMAPASKVSKDDIAAVLAGAAAKGAAARAAVEAEQEQEKAKENSLSSVEIKVPENKIGIVIGPKGSKIKLIQEKTGVTRIDTSGEIFTITGPPQAVGLAEHAIKEMIEKGYCSMAFEDFREDLIPVHPSCFPDLIGKQGVTIKAMKTELGVEVTIPEVPKSATGAKKYKVTLAGKNENVEKAKEVINHIVMYGYHDITHPGQTHEELEVPDWAYRFLIGKAGSEMKHIQNNYKVKVNIPREHSACQQVVVVGEQRDVERAKAYIEKLLWNAENQSKGRDKQDGSIDTWGDEEPQEDWMKAYMYKRT